MKPIAFICQFFPEADKLECFWFSDYFPYFTTHAKLITDLTAKNVPSVIPWLKPNEGLDKLKQVLCKAAVDSLYTVDFNKDTAHPRSCE